MRVSFVARLTFASITCLLCPFNEARRRHLIAALCAVTIWIASIDSTASWGSMPSSSAAATLHEGHGPDRDGRSSIHRSHNMMDAASGISEIASPQYPRNFPASHDVPCGSSGEGSPGRDPVATEPLPRRSSECEQAAHL